MLLAQALKRAPNCGAPLKSKRKEIRSAQCGAVLGSKMLARPWRVLPGLNPGPLSVALARSGAGGLSVRRGRRAVGDHRGKTGFPFSPVSTLETNASAFVRLTTFRVLRPSPSAIAVGRPRFNH